MARRRTQPAPVVPPTVDDAAVAFLTLDADEDILAERVTDDAMLIIATSKGRKFSISPDGEVVQIHPAPRD